ncbi:MAG: Fic family protein, partial [Treponema sp.]|nr:Fic family protein [Treponema sp.]
AYEHFMEFDPYNVKDLLKAHSIMTLGLVDNPGHFRKGGVCVAGKDGITHIAPPADRVPFLISDLFEWLKTSKDHILIKSSVFHYEFEFIHPFEDGNGRMGRFWQSRLLSDWNGAFEHLPIENMIWENQAEYYKVIEKATDSCDSGIFVEFMLQVISDAIHMHDKSDTVNDTVNDTVKLILSLLKENPSISYEELASKTGKSRVTISRKLSELKRNNFIRRVGADKNGHWEVVKDEN